MGAGQLDRPAAGRKSLMIDAISFTGSVPVGRGIAQAAAIGNLTKIQMEMGSKNALAVMDDGDLDTCGQQSPSAAPSAAPDRSARRPRAWSCMSGFHDAYVEKLVAGRHRRSRSVMRLPRGNCRWDRWSSAEQLEGQPRLHRHRQDGRAPNSCAAATSFWSCETDGYYMAPAVFAGTTNDMQHEPGRDVRADCLRDQGGLLRGGAGSRSTTPTSA